MSETDRSRNDAPLSAALDLGDAIAQAKLTVGPAADPFEREADVVADRVVRSLRSGGAGSEPIDGDAAPVAQRVQRSAGVGAAGGAVDGDTERSIQSARGGGKAMPSAMREPMESAFGADFSGVRIHEGSQSADLNDRIQAKAFTVGSDVFFRDGAPDVSSSGGQHLLAHELTHTIQQGGAGVQRTSEIAGEVSQGEEVVQRMPAPATLKKRMGKEAKQGRKVFGKVRGATNTYNKLLAAIDAHSNYIKNQEIGPDLARATAQSSSIITLIGQVEAAAKSYLGKKEKDQEASVTAVCHELIAMAPFECAAAVDLAQFWGSQPTMGGIGKPKWYLVLPTDPRTYTPKTAGDLVDSAVTDLEGGRTEGGQNKEVKQVENAGGDVGFFANDDRDGDYSAEEYEAPKWMLEQYGVQEGEFALGNRSIAMSRLDSLLGAGVIARTERALKGDKLGTFQADASQNGGIAMKNALKANQIDSSSDANLARLLSRLQLIDAIAGQVDRHQGNYFVRFGPNGKVASVTGIDLDMAWTPDSDDARWKFDVEKRVDKYPGFSRFCDKELAEKIIAMQAGDLQAILAHLLTPKEVEAAVARLIVLQGQLKLLQAQGKLLAPNEWTQHVLAEIKDEVSDEAGFDPQKSYFGRDHSDR